MPAEAQDEGSVFLKPVFATCHYDVAEPDFGLMCLGMDRLGNTKKHVVGYRF